MLKCLPKLHFVSLTTFSTVFYLNNYIYYYPTNITLRSHYLFASRYLRRFCVYKQYNITLNRWLSAWSIGSCHIVNDLILYPFVNRAYWQIKTIKHKIVNVHYEYKSNTKHCLYYVIMYQVLCYSLVLNMCFLKKLNTFYIFATRQRKCHRNISMDLVT